MNLNNHLVNNEDGCLLDSATTQTILRNKKYFHNLILTKANVNKISGSANLIGGPEELILCY